jgi:hypothetical protein
MVASFVAVQATGIAPTGGSRQHGKMSAMGGEPDGRRTRPEPPHLTQTGPSWFCQRLFASGFFLVVATADMALPMCARSSRSGPQANHTNVPARAPTRALAATARVSHTGSVTSTLAHPSRGG